MTFITHMHKIEDFSPVMSDRSRGDMNGLILDRHVSPTQRLSANIPRDLQQARYICVTSTGECM